MSAARKAELRGELARAQELWAEASRPDEAARVMLLRGDAESDPRARLAHYTQAASIAPEGHDVRRLARKKRAELVTALAGEGALSAVARHDVLDAARELEEIGELLSAAKSYALAGDAESEARALASAGEVDRLEEVLDGSQTRDRSARKRREIHAEIDLLVASGRRRDALAMAEGFAAEQPDDSIAKGRATELRARRALGPKIAVEVGGVRVDLLVGDAIVVGRDSSLPGDAREARARPSHGSLVITSHAVSRRHLRIARDAGKPVAEDLGSRNGTVMRGVKIAGSLPIGDGLDLRLGGEVPLRVAPSTDMPGAIVIDTGGARYVAPLGPARVGAWHIEPDDAGWLELVSHEEEPAFLGGVMLVPRATLLVGDAISARRGEAPILRVLG